MKRNFVLITIFILVVFGRLSTPVDYALSLLSVNIPDRLTTKIVWLPIVAIIIGLWILKNVNKTNIEKLKSFLLIKANLVTTILTIIICSVITVFSMDYVETLQGWFYYIVLFFIAIFISKNFDKKSFKPFFITIFIINIILLSVAVLQIAAYSLYGSESIIIKIFDNYGGFMPISFYTTEFNDIIALRPSSLMIDPNFLGVFEVSTIIWTSFILQTINQKLEKKKFMWLYMVNLIVASITIIITGSRTALLLIIVYFVIFTIYKTIRNKYKIVMPAILLWDNLKNTLGRIWQAVLFEDESTLERVSYLKIALQAFINNIFTGVGIGNYGIYYGEYTNKPGANTNPHNVYLRILAETGIFGTTLFIFFLYKLTKKVISLKNIHIFSLLAIILIGNLFYDFLMTPWIWFYFGIIYSTALVQQKLKKS